MLHVGDNNIDVLFLIGPTFYKTSNVVTEKTAQ